MSERAHSLAQRSLARRLWRPLPAREWLVGVALAFVLPAIAAALITNLGALDRLPAVPFFLAVVVATSVGRLSAGLIATIVSGVLIVVYELPGVGGTLSLDDVVAVFVFATLSCVISYTLALKDAASDEAARVRSEIESLATTLAAERNTMRQVLEQMPNGVIVADETGSIIVRNGHARDLLAPGEPDRSTGATDDGTSWIARRPDGSRYRPHEYPLDRSLRTGEVVIGERIAIERHDGGVMTLEVDSAPIRATVGDAIVGAVTVFKDITDRIETHARLARSTRRLQQIQAVTDATLSGLGFDDLAERLLRTLRGILETDSATLLLLDRSGTELVEHSTVGVETGGASVTIPVGEGIAGKIASTVATLVADDVRTYEAVRHWLTDEMRSLMGVPLVYRGAVKGVIHVATRQPRSFTAEDVEVLELAASRIASALERASLSDARSAMAQALQRSLMPATLPEIEGVELAALYRPFSPNDEIGGDFYGVFPHGDGSWGIVVGDVSGKGPGAAAVMGLAAHTLPALGRYESRPSAVLKALNEALLRTERVTAERFCTVCEMRVLPGPDGLRVTLCLAGHPQPYLVRADGRVEHVGVAGTILGSFEGPSLHDVVVDLHTGDALIAYTDGLIERRELGLEAGERRLTQLLATHAGRSAGQIVEGIERLLLDESPLDDDVALVVVRQR
jgi:serine phosphatase RsbU (regulator of sigma subunit)